MIVDMSSLAASPPESGPHGPRLNVEAAGYGDGLWLVRDTLQEGGTVFNAPVKACVTSREAAIDIACGGRPGYRI